ncbi:MAG: hypothetical protein B7Z02_02695 [Rhodobacterales bacterium 32-67-9]|nr:MAG: hypothetical protein B7Z02_02695 [Rhodobacterales bacterium 32-67-9]
MSLMGTLAKVAIGVAVAKGVGSMMQKGGASSSGGGGPFGGSYSPGGKGTGLEDMMGDLLGGRTAQAPSGTTRAGTNGDGGILGGSGGGLGDFLEELGQYAPGGGQAAEPSRRRTGGLDDLIGGLGQGGTQGGTQGGGLGDLLGGLLGGLAGAGAGSTTGRGGSFGDILNQSLGNRGEPDVQPTREQDAAAALMLRAMIQAAKSDGKIDAHERDKLLGNLGDVSPEEKRFVDAEMRAPVDIDGLARQVPRGLEAQVYTMSVMAIDLDNRNEAQYLHQLATAMGIDQRQVNQIHARLGVPALYS